MGSDSGDRPVKLSSLLSGASGVPALGPLRRDDPSTEAGAPPGLSMTRQRLGRVSRDLLGGLLGPARSGSSIPNSRWEAVFHKSLCFCTSCWHDASCLLFQTLFKEVC